MGWGELGARTADCWRDFNARYFDGELKPLPICFTPRIVSFQPGTGITCVAHPVTAIGLTRPRNGGPAGRGTLLHEMIHQALSQRGVSPKHADAPWRGEVMRLHYEITGEYILPAARA